MREIKFRAWHKTWSPEENSDGWIDKRGKLLKNGMQKVEGIHDSKRGRSIKMHDWADYTKLTGDIILMQYTGLKDKNSKEIYESDIVEAELINDYGSLELVTAKIVWIQEGLGCYTIDTIGDTGTGYGGMFRINKVIGNIYENPELLDGKM